jgi:hypothetical protein
VQVNLLQAEHNADMMLLAARALTFLADVMPASAASIVRHGAVQVWECSPAVHIIVDDACIPMVTACRALASVYCDFPR